MFRADKVLPLTRIDVSRYAITDPRLRWFIAQGFTFRVVRGAVYLERGVRRPLWVMR